MCRVVNARFFPDSENNGRDYIRLIVSPFFKLITQIQWDTLKQDYVYIFRNKDNSKGLSVYQLIEWFNLVLPYTVYVNTREMQEMTPEEARAKRRSNPFNTPEIEYSKQWRNWLTIQKVFTLLLFVYVVIRGDLFSILLAGFYLCYASLFNLHIPYNFFHISSIALQVFYLFVNIQNHCCDSQVHLQYLLNCPVCE